MKTSSESSLQEEEEQSPSHSVKPELESLSNEPKPELALDLTGVKNNVEEELIEERDN
jgi:hypothetical protein